MKDSYSFWTKEEMDLVHKYSMEILAETGVDFMGEEAIEIFKAHGFRVEGNTVFFKEEDVWNAVNGATKSYEWLGRDSSVTIGAGKQIIAGSYGPIYILEDGEFHAPTAENFMDYAKLTATSKVLHVSNPNTMDLCFMPRDIVFNWAMATTLALDTKPALGIVDGKQKARDAIAMTQEFYGVYDKVVLTGLINCASPSRYTVSMCEALIEYARAGQAVILTPSSMCGLTAPDTIASMLLLNNVEILAGIVLAQLITPGLPVIYGNQGHGSDLRFTVPTVGSPEQFLIFNAIKGMADYYGLPARTGGTCTDAKMLDMQAGAEAFSSFFACAQANVDFTFDTCGMLDSDNALSFEKMVFDEEIMLSVQHILRGIKLDESTLLVDKIKKAGPGGNFLGRTSKLYRHDHLPLQIPVRETHSIWLNQGAPTVVGRCKEIVKKRLDEYVMPELSKERREILEKYVPAELLKF